MLNVIRNYLSGFQQIANYKQNSPTTNDIAILKIISYAFLIPTVYRAISWAATSLYGRLKKGPTPKDVDIADKANQILGTAASDQPSPRRDPAELTPVSTAGLASKPENQPTSSAQLKPSIQTVVSPATINPRDTFSSDKPFKLYIRETGLSHIIFFPELEKSLKDTGFFTQVEIINYKRINKYKAVLSETGAVVINFRSDFDRANPDFDPDRPTVIFTDRQSSETTSKHVIFVRYQHQQSTITDVEPYFDPLINLIKKSAHPVTFDEVTSTVITPIETSLSLIPMKSYIRHTGLDNILLPTAALLESLIKAGLCNNIEIIPFTESDNYKNVLNEEGALVVDFRMEFSRHDSSIKLRRPTVIFTTATFNTAIYDGVIYVTYKMQANKITHVENYSEQLVTLIKDYLEFKHLFEPSTQAVVSSSQAIDEVKTES